MGKINFVKVHGLGNDFVILDFIRENKNKNINLSQAAKYICNRNLGIGADGLVIINDTDEADIEMRMFNPDGTEAEMCGNAIRCVAMYVKSRNISNSSKITVKTGAGILTPEIIESGKNSAQVRVDMGRPELKPANIPVNLEGERVVDNPIKVNGIETNITCVSMGNPHCVIFAPEITEKLVSSMGPLIESHEIFPRKTNVEFVKVINREEMIMRVWERGAGQTLACGTGACATLVAAVLNNHADRKAVVHLAGGDLTIEWSEDDRVFMTGLAEEVFTGKIDLTTIKGVTL